MRKRNLKGEIIMCKKVYLKAKEAEQEMQLSRNEEGYVGK